MRTISYDDMVKYLDNEYDTIFGFIGKSGDFPQMTSRNDVYDWFRLDYGETKHVKDVPYFIECPNSLPNSKIDIPRSEYCGGDLEQLYPYTGNGFTAAIDGTIMPEYRIIFDHRMPMPDNAIIYTVGANGQKLPLFVYDGASWIKHGIN